MEGTPQTIEELVNIIFSHPPRPPCTYNIALAEEMSNNVTIFQLLMNVLVAGAKKLYGENVTPNDISEAQFEELKRYIESLGYQIKYNYKFLIDDPNIDDKDKPRIMNIWFEHITLKIDCHGRPIY